MTELQEVVRASTAQSREFGEELRRARVRAGLTVAALAEALGWSMAKVTKLEKGSRGASEWDIGALLGRCGAEKATRERLRRLAAMPSVGWFSRSHWDEPADELVCLAVHEPAALTLDCYAPMVVPALAQCPEYARALGGDPAVRLRRQSALSAVPTFCVHEAALSLVIGDERVMLDQMLKLVLLGTVRVIPFSAGGHWALRFPSTLMTFDLGVAPVVHTETDTVAVFVDDGQAVRIFQHKHAVLDGLALSLERSREVLLERVEAYR